MRVAFNLMNFGHHCRLATWVRVIHPPSVHATALCVQHHNSVHSVHTLLPLPLPLTNKQTFVDTASQATCNTCTSVCSRLSSHQVPSQPYYLAFCAGVLVKMWCSDSFAICLTFISPRYQNCWESSSLEVSGGLARDGRFT